MNNEIDGFKSIVAEMVALKEKKSSDYRNVWRAFGLQGVYSSLARKFTRLWINKDKEVANESIEDTLMDLAVYSIMALQLIREKDTSDKILDILTK